MKRMYSAIILAAAISGAIPMMASAVPVYNADNTIENKRDRNHKNLTAQDQSNSRCAIKTTAKLRREIMRTKGLSQNAQNVKIIDKNGSITLRGPVDTENEKATIENLARQCCGSNVNSELEVKTP